MDKKKIIEILTTLHAVEDYGNMEEYLSENNLESLSNAIYNCKTELYHDLGKLCYEESQIIYIKVNES